MNDANHHPEAAPIRMLDLRGEYAIFAGSLRDRLENVLASGHYIGGPAVAELEKALATRQSVKHAIAISNGSDALLCALMALGIGRGDEVIIPTFTFFATAGTVHRVGAAPVFVDCDPRTYNIDIEKLKKAITAKTKAVIPVHLFGQCADMASILAIADEHGLAVLEDAAQAIDATQDGRFAGAIAPMGALSFYPTKNLGGFGEGGMILCQNDDLALRCRQLRNHGQSKLYFHDFVGGNFRLDTLKAAILLTKLEKLTAFTAARAANAALYDELLAGSGVVTPRVGRGNRHVYHQYCILTPRRDELKKHLADHGVESGIYYPLPLHRQPCFAYLETPKDHCPVADDVCGRILALPVQPLLTEPEIRRVAELIRDFQRKER